MRGVLAAGKRERLKTPEWATAGSRILGFGVSNKASMEPDSGTSFESIRFRY